MSASKNNNPIESNKSVILIVDDKPANLDILFQHLDQAGFKTLVATSGERAILQVERLIPDLILLDVMMPPGIDGFETCRRLKAGDSTKDIPVIFITSLSEIQDKIKGFQAGGVDYITKPFNKEEVLARVNSHLTIQKQRKELKELNATKDRFFSIIAHDLRGVFNPMMVASDVLSKLVKKFQYDNIAKFSDTIYDSIRNAYALLENLLEWARLQRGSMEFAPAEINLHKVVFKIADYLSLNAKQKSIEIVNAIQNDMFAFADQNMIETVIRNLITNSIKFTKEGSITISGIAKDNEVEISVADTGTGIEPENVRKLFRIDEKFKQNGTSGEKGTGLGLILCKEFIEKNNGKIRVESEIGKGSKFIFSLPAIAIST